MKERSLQNTGIASFKMALQVWLLPFLIILINSLPPAELLSFSSLGQLLEHRNFKRNGYESVTFKSYLYQLRI